jgi:DNA mismatch repair ATPase MutS
MESNKEILRRIEEEKMPLQEIIQDLESFTEIKDIIKELEESKTEAESKEAYDSMEKDLSLAKENLEYLTKTISKYFQEDKKEYMLDEIEEKLKKLYKKQYELKTQIDSN